MGHRLSHWGAEGTGRWVHLPREQRLWPHCGDGREMVAHISFQCSLPAALRARFSALLKPAHSTLCTSSISRPHAYARMLAGWRRPRPLQLEQLLWVPLHARYAPVNTCKHSRDASAKARN